MGRDDFPDPVQTRQTLRIVSEGRPLSFRPISGEARVPGAGIVRSLIQTNEARTRHLKRKELALDTAQDAVDLVSFYERHRFQKVSTTRWDSTNYVSVVMSKKIR